MAQAVSALLPADAAELTPRDGVRGGHEVVQVLHVGDVADVKTLLRTQAPVLEDQGQSVAHVALAAGDGLQDQHAQHRVNVVLAGGGDALLVQQRVRQAEGHLRLVCAAGGAEVRAGGREAAAVMQIQQLLDEDIGLAGVHQEFSFDVNVLSARQQFVRQRLGLRNLLLGEVRGVEAARRGVVAAFGQGLQAVQQLVQVQEAEVGAEGLCDMVERYEGVVAALGGVGVEAHGQHDLGLAQGFADPEHAHLGGDLVPGAAAVSLQPAGAQSRGDGGQVGEDAGILENGFAGALAQLDQKGTAGDAAADQIGVHVIADDTVEHRLGHTPVVVALAGEGLHDVDTVGHVRFHIAEELGPQLLHHQPLIFRGQGLALGEAAGALIVVTVHDAEKHRLHIQLDVQSALDHLRFLLVMMF